MVATLPPLVEGMVSMLVAPVTGMTFVQLQLIPAGMPAARHLPLTISALYTLGGLFQVTAAHTGGRLAHELDLPAQLPGQADYAVAGPASAKRANLSEGGQVHAFGR